MENFEAYFKKQQADSNCGFAEEYEVCDRKRVVSGPLHRKASWPPVSVPVMLWAGSNSHWEWDGWWEWLLSVPWGSPVDWVLPCLWQLSSSPAILPLLSACLLLLSPAGPSTPLPWPVSLSPTLLHMTSF